MYRVADLRVTACPPPACRLDGPPPLLPTSNIFPLLHLLGGQSHLLLQRAVTTAVAALAHPGLPGQPACLLPRITLPSHLPVQLQAASQGCV